MQLFYVEMVHRFWNTFSSVPFAICPSSRDFFRGDCDPFSPSSLVWCDEVPPSSSRSSSMPALGQWQTRIDHGSRVVHQAWVRPQYGSCSLIGPILRLRCHWSKIEGWREGVTLPRRSLHRPPSPTPFTPFTPDTVTLGIAVGPINTTSLLSTTSRTALKPGQLELLPSLVLTRFPFLKRPYHYLPLSVTDGRTYSCETWMIWVKTLSAPWQKRSWV